MSTFRNYLKYTGVTITDYGTPCFSSLHQIMGLKGSDAGNAPNLLQATNEYENFILTGEGINCNAQDDRDAPNGMIFYGTKGSLVAEPVGFEINPEPIGRNESMPRCQPISIVAKDPTPEHAIRLVDCVRGAQPPNSTAESAHMATNSGQLGNIALRTGREF